jgi:hypothetical protein
VTSFNSLGAGAALIAACVGPAIAHAQGGQEAQSRAVVTAGASARSGAQRTPLLTPAVAARLAPMKWMYVTSLRGDGGTPQRIGFRTISLTEATYRGTPAWLVVEVRQMHTVAYAESLYVSKADLTPMHRVRRTPTSTVVSEYGADSIRTTFDDDSGHVTGAMADEPGLLAGLYLIEPLIGASQLDAQWATTSRLAAIGRDESGVVDVETRVVGAEKVQIPDGTFDAWVVTMRIGSSGETFWVRKTDGVVLKEVVPALGMAGATVEAVLGLNGVER